MHSLKLELTDYIVMDAKIRKIFIFRNVFFMNYLYA